VSELAIITFRNSVPGAQELAETIAHNPTIQALNQTVWAFSLVEISHLLFLVLLGGATLVLALRTLGLTLNEASVQDVEGLTRPWLRVGTIGGSASGIFMSIATALTLVANGAFFIKILALVAAVLFSFALAGRLRGRSKGVVQATLGLIALAYALWLFASTRGLNTGAMLVGAVSAAFLLLAAAGRLRGQDDGAADRLSQWLAIGTVVAWLTVTIAGRWIGFS
jgi:hypothetical protein